MAVRIKPESKSKTGTTLWRSDDDSTHVRFRFCSSMPYFHKDQRPITSKNKIKNSDVVMGIVRQIASWHLRWAAHRVRTETHYVNRDTPQVKCCRHSHCSRSALAARLDSQNIHVMIA